MLFYSKISLKTLYLPEYLLFIMAHKKFIGDFRPKKP